LLEKKESIEQTISNLNNISHVLSLSEENKRLLQESIDRRRELTEKLKNIKDELMTISNEKETLLSLKDKVDSLRVDFNNLNLEKDRLIALKKEILEDNECLYNKNIISSCVRKLHELERNLTSDISTITAKIESYKTQMISVETLKSRKAALEVKKDLYELAYNIWSTDGYPSLLINDFLEEVTECTNKDLDSSWGGILNIKKPELESSALKIPVIRGNAELDDVSECSKAEKATLDLAISFGILEVSTIDSKFGIITRIDEKDSGMDVVRRQNFLDLLQERLKTINCINAFCITHSNCFENIEADVILLKNYESVTSENALDNKNIIYRFDKSV
jgi:DNA repair exonuclease SbcCD ATPase subunit